MPSSGRDIVPVPGFPGEYAARSVLDKIKNIAAAYHVRLTDAYGPGHESPGHTIYGTAADFSGPNKNMDRAVRALVREGYRVLYDGRFGSIAWPGHGPSTVAGGRAHFHVELDSSRGDVTARGRKNGKRDGPADWLKQAGWPNNLIPTMVAIGGAESRWRIDAVGGPNGDGTYDYGWLQINSIHGYDKARLLSDPVYTARAARTIYRQQGFGAWSVYNSGAYKGFTGKTPATATTGRVRPGGDTSDDSSDVDTVLAGFWDSLPNPFGPLSPIDPRKPANAAKDAVHAVKSTVDFLKWIAWIFHPRNILRVNEFMVGLSLMFLGIWTLVKVWQGAESETPFRLLGDTVKTGITRKPTARSGGTRTHGRGTGRRHRARTADDVLDPANP